MDKKYSVAVVLYVLTLVLAFVFLLAGGEKSEGFFDFSGLSTAFGLGIAILGTLLFALYVLFVYAYSRSRKAFAIMMAVMFGILLTAAAASAVRSWVVHRQDLDFSSAIVLQPGIEHFESYRTDSLESETKYKYLPQRDGELTIELSSDGFYRQIRGLSVYDSRKKRIFKQTGTVPPSVKVEGVASGQWIYVSVQTGSAYDVYRINMHQ